MHIALSQWTGQPGFELPLPLPDSPICLHELVGYQVVDFLPLYG